ncbi:hypothetical protein [Streptosporangium roseum]|uniref:hypothetical protein n=1 Tax=Streptosporangium roseum TaxID=2001 RepID=UPI0011D29AE3|nr:hypothetical protein [Streptosporangium roseum]
MSDLTGQFLDLPAGRTHCRLDGPADAPVVVFVPGATLSTAGAGGRRAGAGAGGAIRLRPVSSGMVGIANHAGLA